MIKIADLMQSSVVAFVTSGARGTVEALNNPVCYVSIAGAVPPDLATRGRSECLPLAQ